MCSVRLKKSVAVSVNTMRPTLVCAGPIAYCDNTSNKNIRTWPKFEPNDSDTSNRMSRSIVSIQAEIREVYRMINNMEGVDIVSIHAEIKNFQKGLLKKRGREHEYCLHTS